MNPRKLVLPAAGVAFAAIVTATFAVPAQDGTSTFGFARSTSLIERGELPRSKEVVVADLLDYHHHALPTPKAGECVALDVRCATASAAPGGEAWLQIGIATTRAHDLVELPPVALALAVDCSGSMADAGKMEAVHAGLARLVGRLRRDDRLAIIAWSDGARTLLPMQRVGDGSAARCAIEHLRPAGSTNLEEGLRRAFEAIAAADTGPSVARRVLLLTDGIANTGITDPEQILESARPFFEQGLDLATIGVGHDVNHDLLQRLARGGRGLYHFVADCRDLEKIFVDDLQALLLPVARRVRLDVELPAGVSVGRVFGHDCAKRRSGFSVALDDLNAGLTQVVIARLDVAADATGCESLRARLSFDAVTGAGMEGDAPHTLLATTPLRLTACDRALAVDPEVKKNLTIALLADALHESAAAAEEGSMRTARRLLTDALATAQAHFPSDDDPDVRRIEEMLRGAERVIAQRLAEVDCTPCRAGRSLRDEGR